MHKARVLLVRYPHKADSAFGFEDATQARQRADALARLHECDWREVREANGDIVYRVEASDYYRKGHKPKSVVLFPQFWYKRQEQEEREMEKANRKLAHNQKDIVRGALVDYSAMMRKVIIDHINDIKAGRPVRQSLILKNYGLEQLEDIHSFIGSFSVDSFVEREYIEIIKKWSHKQEGRDEDTSEE